MPIDVRITTTAQAAAGRGAAGAVAARTMHVVQLTEPRQEFSLPSGVEPANVELDPDAWVMMRATFVKK
jgi:hypothetical protein